MEYARVDYDTDLGYYWFGTLRCNVGSEKELLFYHTLPDELHLAEYLVKSVCFEQLRSQVGTRHSTQANLETFFFVEAHFIVFFLWSLNAVVYLDCKCPTFIYVM